ncbi:suppressor of fused domain protein [Acetobacter orleanensis]|uniref:Suppressor of fused-like domain-containing protein n=1 Tax=Acetobacter orleanensis TaxID=104099 RepID=A0A4Y3TTA6_9PROT|nr:suppressor of fused domain protein [Acetobacter orleanensis]KXV64966.1 hypothetical protein AD949_05125 [Acetobacter orleanensis]PCD78863.1 hypothetical protein CO710_09630 [Acetobacter orleanensis]GAN69723.1 hypothetical protein Abol_059_002 [Acetobacter orleanensis JCM 7639]GBR29212.1 hypothetical protein AA0473_1968 [Acetobacter orleanensis NRIC 0473]GEB84190.1 hypothetical protein AOR01nite_26670 [Acetobacter orleanensis]
MKKYLPNVLEREFGEIDASMNSILSRKVQIIKYQGKDGLSFISTLGLSNMDNNDNKFEWIMEFEQDFPSEQAASMMDYFLKKLVDTKLFPPKRGSYISFPKESDHIWSNDNLCGIYFTYPFYRSKKFDDSLSEIDIVPVWVVPITKFEKDILENEGWTHLENYWNIQNINLHNPYRS